MPLFKITIQTTYHHKKVDNIFRWFIKDPNQTITYDQLNEKLKTIINNLNYCNPNHNDYDLIDDYQILWYDGEDFCRIISTEDLHDAIETLTESNDNNKPIRIYIATNGCELMKQQFNHIPKVKKTINELQLPDLPETLEKLDINNHNDLDTNKKSIINNQSSSSSSDPNLYHDPNLPSAPLLNSTSMDLFLSSLQLPYNHLNYMKLPQNYQAYATTTTYIPYQQSYLQNKMNLNKLPLPSSSSSSSSALRSSLRSPSSSSSSSSTCISSNDKQKLLTNHYGLKRNSQYTASCMNLSRLPNSSSHSNNNKEQINISAIIIRLRHMGFQQSDMYLSSLIQQYNGNLNPILDRLSYDNNMKS
ncbi:unnamed protein product [Schistosoma rodhaini]|uniref:PB1 domain-containing protein n=1 Tax=Schistosoma rodhaini TaxID=6188 RepID=A0A183QV31_9TREM|nr:unnamed protein product [Schistosoma rodhaini]